LALIFLKQGLSVSLKKEENLSTGRIFVLGLRPRIKERLGRSSSSSTRSLKAGKERKFLEISALVRAV